jgi:tetratricopeptide (TPR) repeat protein
MVRRRLNKKVAFLGSAFFLIIALSTILVLLQFKRDPKEFIKDAEAAIQVARQANDQKIKDENYDIAKRKYSSVYSRVKTNQEREQILFDMVDLFIETKDWPYVLDCWDKILLIEPDNIKAQYGRLRYYEILGQSGFPKVWQQVHDYASDFLKTAQEENLLNKSLTDLQIPALEQGQMETRLLGAYLYLTRGEGAFEQANMGAVTNVEEMLNAAASDFGQAKGLEPNNIDVYLNLAQTAVAKGELAASKGNADEREKAGKQALTYLEQGINNSSNTPEAYINYLNFKLMLTRTSDPNQMDAQIKSLEPEYMSLQNKFSTNADVFETVSQFYSVYSQYTKLKDSKQNLDKAIDAASNALKLDDKNAVYAIQLSDLCHRRFSIYKSEPDLYKAIDIAKGALSLPDAQNSPGPRNNIRIRNKYLLNSFLANSYIEQIIEPLKELSESEKGTLLNEAQQAVHEIETIVGASEDPIVVKWQGMLELAKGNRQDAVVKLNKAYEQLKAVKPSQPPWPLDLDFAQLSYTLAKLFMDTDELSKVHEFLVSAHYSGITEIKPEARLDYVEVVLQFNRLSDALQNLDAFEQDYGPTDRSRQLRVRTYIYSSKFDEAQKVLDTMPTDDADTIDLRLTLAEARIRQIQMAMVQEEKQNDVNSITADVNIQKTPELKESRQKALDDIKAYTQLSIGYIEKLLQIKPDIIDQSSILNICRNCIAGNEIQQAQEVVKAYLSKFPDNISVNIYRQILSEPEPANISQQRYAEIEQQVVSGISDPVKRAVNLGIFYRRNGDNAKAIEQLNIALDAADSIEPNQASPELDNIKLAASHLFDIALSTNNLDVAEKVTKIVRDKNLDGLGGLFFDARLTVAKKDLKGALAKVDECLKKRPIFSQLYMLRGSIDAALGNSYAYMEDITKAAYMNPLDGTIAKRFALALYNRNQSLGSEATSAQVNETRDALEKAIALNQGDLELLGIYTEYIAPTEPARAVAIRQDMLSAVPSLDNAMLLGTLAMNVAENASNSDAKEGFYDIADSAFEQARKIDPNNRQVLLYYTRYLQARGRNEQARKLLEQSQDTLLLANNLYQQGDYEGAKKELEKIYNNVTRDTDVLRGLMLVAQKLNDQESVKKYSEELLSADNNVNNLISQIRAFLTVGLVTDAQYKLQSLREKYPDEPSVPLLQAWLQFKQNDSKKALETINNYLQNNKTNPAAWQLRSEINVALANYDRAISDLKTSKSLSNDPAVGILLAKVYIQVSRFDDAVAELRDIVSKPNPPVEAKLILENVYLQLNRKTALKSFYDDILSKYPDNAQWLVKAAAYALKTEEFERAEKFYKKACVSILENYSGAEQGKEIDNDLYVTAFDGYLEALLDDTGDSDKDNFHPEKSETVVKEAQKYINSSYAPLAYLRMAQAELNLHEEDKAVEYCHLSLGKIGADDKYASEVLLRMYPIIGLDAITNYCAQTLEKNPDSLPANYTMYYLMRINNEYDKSIDYINKCIELVGKDSPIRNDYIIKKAETLLFAYAYTSDTKYINTAINDYESLLTEMPNNIKVLNNLAYMLAESNQKLTEALKYSQHVQQLKPNDPASLDTYAFVLFKNGKVTEAEETIDEALRQYTEQGQIDVPGEVYEHKGMIKEKLDKKEEAFTAYKRALELGSKYFTQKTKDRINQAIERVSP